MAFKNSYPFVNLAFKDGHIADKTLRVVMPSFTIAFVDRRRKQRVPPQRFTHLSLLLGLKGSAKARLRFASTGERLCDQEP
jgi:hypothetical protein